MASSELTSSAPQRGPTLDWALSFAAAYGALWLVTAMFAYAALVIEPLRELVATVFSPMSYPHAPADAAGVAHLFGANVSRGWPLLVALGPIRRFAWAVRLTDRVIVANLALNAALVGGGIALAGAAIVPYLIHLPVEWAALAVTVAGWVDARRGASRLALAGYLAAFVMLLLAAAVLETYAVPHI